MQGLVREGPERDGPDEPDVEALFLQVVDGGLADTRHGAEGGDDYLSVLHVVGLETDLVLFYFTVGGLQALIEAVKLLDGDIQAVDDGAAGLSLAP